MSNGTKDPNAPPAPDDTRFGELANIRGTYGREMENNPDLRRQLIATTHQEVGEDDDVAHQALIETVFNRAAARKMTLEQALHSIHQPPNHPIKNDPGYWDYRTGIAQQKPVDQDVQDRINPMIDRALAGSNVSAFSTGNQSPDPNNPGFKMFKPQFDPHQKSRDTFVVEEPKSDQDWFKGMVMQQKRWHDQGQPVTPDVGPVNALKDVPANPPAPRAQPVVQPVVRKALPVAQADSEGASLADTDTDDEDDPAYHWPVA
jgi:hypothetical protein